MPESILFYLAACVALPTRPIYILSLSLILLPTTLYSSTGVEVPLFFTFALHVFSAKRGKIGTLKRRSRKHRAGAVSPALWPGNWLWPSFVVCFCLRCALCHSGWKIFRDARQFHGSRGCGKSLGAERIWGFALKGPGACSEAVATGIPPTRTCGCRRYLIATAP